MILVGIDVLNVLHDFRTDRSFCLRRASMVIIGIVLMTCLCVSCIDLDVPNFTSWPADATGYDIEELPELISASYSRGDNVVWSRVDGHIERVDDSTGGATESLGRAQADGSKLLFIAKSGTLFSSAYHMPVMRSDDDGQTWTECLDVPCWRMDEDDQGALYTGNYTKDGIRVATLYKSIDDGISWDEIFRRDDNDHIHTVRWDDVSKRLYIAYGDQSTRGQAYSDDHGETFHTIVEGPAEGHTDVAISDHYLFWCTDDGSGRVFRVDRDTGDQKTVLTGVGYVWFGVARGSQIYVGTVSSQDGGGDRGALLASNDDGETWQKLLETRISTEPYSVVVEAESRELSAGNWLYFSADMEDGLHSFRVRRNR